MIAAEYGKDEILEELNEQHAELALRDTDGDTAISMAIANGHTSVLKVLLDYGVEIHGLDKAGRTLLHIACNSEAEIVRLLVEKGLILDARANRGETPLHDASRAGNLDIIQVLLDLGAYQLITDASDRTPLIVAWQHGTAEIVKLLQGSRGTQGFPDKGQITGDEYLPLGSITKLGYRDLVRTAIRKKDRNFNVRETDGNNTALHRAVDSVHPDHPDHPDHLGILEMLLDVGMSPNEISKHGRTPLYLAAYFGDLEANKLPLQFNAQLELKDVRSLTLAVAQSEKKYFIAISLIEEGLLLKTGRKRRSSPRTSQQLSMVV